MQSDRQTTKFYTLWIYGFIAGFLATLTFHQGALLILRAAGIAPFGPFSMAATHPWGIPAVISLALWGGVWGVLFAFLQSPFAVVSNYWIRAFLFGAVFPTMVALLMVLPLKGKPVGGGWHWQLLLTAFLTNGAWGFGTGFFLKPMLRFFKGRHAPSPECAPGMTC